MIRHVEEKKKKELEAQMEEPEEEDEFANIDLHGPVVVP